MRAGRFFKRYKRKIYIGGLFTFIYFPIISYSNGLVSIHQCWERTDSIEIFFLETNQYNSFEELLRQFKGHQVYIDIWATWCTPCIEAFEHYSFLQSLAKKEKLGKVFNE